MQTLRLPPSVSGMTPGIPGGRSEAFSQPPQQSYGPPQQYGQWNGYGGYSPYGAPYGRNYGMTPQAPPQSFYPPNGGYQMGPPPPPPIQAPPPPPPPPPAAPEPKPVAAAPVEKPLTDEDKVGKLVASWLKHYPQWKNYIPPQTLNQLEGALQNPDSLNQMMTGALAQGIKQHLGSGFMNRMGLKATEKMLVSSIPAPFNTIVSKAFQMVHSKSL